MCTAIIMLPPEGFVDLCAALKKPDNTFVNIIGVVVDVMTPTQTRADWMLTARILDRGLADSIEGFQGLTCRFFRADRDLLPRVRGIGDVLLLRHMKMLTFNGTRIAVSNYQTNTLLFPGGSIPSQAFSIAYTDKQRVECLGIPKDVDSVNLVEQEYVIKLKHAMSNNIESTQLKMAKRNLAHEEAALAQPQPKKQRTTGSYGFGAKFKLVKDLNARMYADLCGIVVKRISTNYGCDMYITDYTANEQMRYYTPPEEETSKEREGDVFGYSGPPKRAWQGPWGWLVLKINVKPPHARFANSSVNEGDIVLLKNVKTRITQEGTWLEGDMWPDDLDSRKIQIARIINMETPEIQAMLQRREKYWKAREAQAHKADAEKQQPTKLTKAEKKKQKKELKRQREAEASFGNQVAEPASADKSKTNPHIKCGHQEVAVSRVRDILDSSNLQHVNDAPGGVPYVLPFMNARYRAKVRVVDYEPKALDDFAVQPEPELGSSPDTIAWQYASPKYEWSFSLLLEDATKKTSLGSEEHDRVWVHLQHEQAQFLLGNGIDDPDDLRHNPELLRKLREKLFILWGNLEEVGSGDSEEVSNRPFECCIEEYGVELDDEVSSNNVLSRGWQRMYSMFGATIL